MVTEPVCMYVCLSPLSLSLHSSAFWSRSWYFGLVTSAKFMTTITPCLDNVTLVVVQKSPQLLVGFVDGDTVLSSCLSLPTLCVLVSAVASGVRGCRRSHTATPETVAGQHSQRSAAAGPRSSRVTRNYLSSIPVCIYLGCCSLRWHTVTGWFGVVCSEMTLQQCHAQIYLLQDALSYFSSNLFPPLLSSIRLKSCDVSIVL